MSKPQAQELLHAVEELYFFRRYSEGADFVRKVLHDGPVGDKLDEDTRELLAYYERKCTEKMGQP